MPDTVAGPCWVPPAKKPPLSSRMPRATWRGLPARRHEVGFEPGLVVPASDGSPLITDHYVPRAEGDFPTLLVRSPYGRGLPWSAMYGLLFAEQGFHVVLQSCRGTGGSGGAFDLWRNEAADGRATVNCSTTGRPPRLPPAGIPSPAGSSAGGPPRTPRR